MIRIEVPVTTSTSYPVAEAKAVIQDALTPYDSLLVVAGGINEATGGPPTPSDPRDVLRVPVGPSSVEVEASSASNLQPSGMLGRMCGKVQADDKGVITAGQLFKSAFRTLFRYALEIWPDSLMLATAIMSSGTL